MRGHSSRKATFLVQKGWPYKRGAIVYVIYKQYKLSICTTYVIHTSKQKFYDLI